MNHARLLRGPFLIPLLIVCFALLPRAQAVSPAPDGCYPNYTTAEGCNALQFLGAGAGNTGLGWYSLFLVGDGNFNTGVGGGALALNTADSNTAVGAAALLLNTTGAQNTAVGTDAMVFNDSGSGRYGCRLLCAHEPEPPPAPTRPSVGKRSSTLPPASITRPWVFVPWSLTPTARITRPSVI